MRSASYMKGKNENGFMMTTNNSVFCSACVGALRSGCFIRTGPVSQSALRGHQAAAGQPDHHGCRLRSAATRGRRRAAPHLQVQVLLLLLTCADWPVPFSKVEQRDAEENPGVLLLLLLRSASAAMCHRDICHNCGRAIKVMQLLMLPELLL